MLYAAAGNMDDAVPLPWS